MPWTKDASLFLVCIQCIQYNFINAQIKIQDIDMCTDRQLQTKEQLGTALSVFQLNFLNPEL